jgi:hypothetical protein
MPIDVVVMTIGFRTLIEWVLNAVCPVASIARTTKEKADRGRRAGDVTRSASERPGTGSAKPAPSTARLALCR